MLKKITAIICFLSGLICCFEAVQAAAVVTRPVAVASVSETHATLVWHTDIAATSRVEYGSTLALGKSIRTKSQTQNHEVTIPRLNPGQRYYYRVFTNEELLYSGSSYNFTTLPTKERSKIRFLAWGDSGKGTSEQNSLVPPMTAAQADFMIHTGDVIYNNGEARNFNPRYYLPYQDFLRSTPVYLAIGNHDLHSFNGQPYLDAFHLPTNSLNGSERFYSFNYGQAHVVCLDSNGALPQSELDWLANDLAQATTAWKFVFFHHPPYSCGLHGSDTFVRQRFAPILEQYGVDIVFTGHDHDYQRSFPMRDNIPVDTNQGSNYFNPAGTIYVVTGGGAIARATKSSCSFTHTAISATHFVQIDIDGPQLTARAIDPNGAILDEFTINKTAMPIAQSESSGEQRSSRLLANVPNPFNPVTLVRYQLQHREHVQLSIFDLRGRRLKTLSSGAQDAGTYRVLWDGRDERGAAMSSGIYFLKLQAGGELSTRKILLAK